MSYQQALHYIQAGHFEAAIAELDPLLEADPAQPALWQAKALALLSGGHPEAAIAAADQVLRLNPTMAAGHRLLGRAYGQVGNTEAAIAAYKQATRHYLDQQDKANAQACLDQIEQLRPQKPILQSLAASQNFLQGTIVKLQTGQYREALQDLNWLLQVEPGNANALAQRGLVHAHCHNHQAAVKDLAQAMQLAPEDPDVRLKRGETRLLLGDGHGAIGDFSALLQQQAGDASQLYALRGKAYQAINDLDNAFKDFSNALGMAPDNADCYQARGSVYEAMSDLKEALANYRQAATLYLDQGNWAAHQRMQQHIQALEPKHQYQIDEAARIIRVPIKYLNDGAPIIEVIVNGFYPIDMVLYPAAGMTVLTAQLAQTLNVVPTGMKRFYNAEGHLIEAPVGVIRSLAVDRAQVSNLEVAISATATEGLLGQNYLWRYDVRILPTEVELYQR